jgi:hypothetical protein
MPSPEEIQHLATNPNRRWGTSVLESDRYRPSEFGRKGRRVLRSEHHPTGLNSNLHYLRFVLAEIFTVSQNNDALSAMLRTFRAN